jgi:hypothetical protein
VDQADGATASVVMHSARVVTAQFQAMQRPMAAALAITTAEDTESAGAAPLVSDADPNDSHTVRIVGQPLHGSAAMRNNLVYYLPAADFNGKDSFAIQVTDRYGLELAAPATVQVMVTPVNDPPRSASANGSGQNDGQPILLVIEVDDPDEGDSFTWALEMLPAHGSVAPGEGRTAQAPTTPPMRYTPDPGFAGEDRFTFRLTDSGGASVTGQATVTVTPPVGGEQALFLPSLRQ